MREDFEQKMKVLHEQYGTFSMEDRRRILCHLRRKNLLLYRQVERIKHDLLRMESKRVQMELDGNEKQAAACEQKILKKKEQYLKALTKNKL